MNRLRTSLLWATLVATSGCVSVGHRDTPSHGSAPSPRAQPPTTAARPTPPPPLPAGLYFRDGHYERGACTGCVEPRWVVVEGIHGTAAEATVALQSAPSTLPLGYPWAVHTDDLALADADRRGIAVVVGLFASRGDAAAYGSTHRRTSDSWQVVALASEETALQRLHGRLARPDYGDERPHVIQVDRAAGGQGVAAYSAEELEPLVRALYMEPTWESFEEFLLARRQLPNGLSPRCLVPSGTVHLVHGYEELLRFNRDLLPAPCPDGQIAYVPMAATRVETVVTSGADGAARMVQVVVVECDVATFDEWAYTETGRRALGEGEERIVLASAGCGEP